MNKPPGLNFLFASTEGDEMGSVATAPLARLMRPMTFALWCVITAAQAIAMITTGEGVNLVVVFLSTLIFGAVHIQFWYEESEQGRKLHYAMDRVRGKVYEDDSTGLPNSRHFVFELRRQMMRSVRNGRGFSLILADMNSAGRPDFERAFPIIGKTMRRAAGDGDFIAHLEGSVFAAVVRDEDDRSAAEKAVAMHAELRELAPSDRSGAFEPVVSLTGYQGELEVRDFLRRAQRDLLAARSRGPAASAIARGRAPTATHVA